MDKNTAIDHAASGFLQAVGWLVASAVIGAVVFLFAHIAFLLGLLPAAAFIYLQKKRQQRSLQVKIYPTEG
jgi:hypothetical protein